MKTIQITPERAIGDGERPFIIAEIGNNHNGDMDIARELVEKAAEAGADSVKFQTKDIESSFSQELLDKPYTGPNSFGTTYREHKEALELSEEQMYELRDLAASLGLIFFSTPFDTVSVEMLMRLDIPLYKISSFHLTDLPLIEAVCRTGKPFLISTGMSTLEEIDASVQLIRQFTEDFVLMQTTSAYPTDLEDVNLRVISRLRERYGCLVGFSGHERGVSISPGAVLMGACAIERHFTLDRTMKGPDHSASAEPEGLALLVRRSKNFHIALGSPDKAPLLSELENRKKFRGY